MFVADIENPDVRTKLEAHGVVEGEELECEATVLPSYYVTSGRVFYKSQAFDDKEAIDMVQGIQLDYFDTEINGSRSVSFGQLRGKSVETAFDYDTTPFLGLFGTSTENGISSMGWIYHDIECKSTVDSTGSGYVPPDETDTDSTGETDDSGTTTDTTSDDDSGTSTGETTDEGSTTDDSSDATVVNGSNNTGTTEPTSLNDVLISLLVAGGSSLVAVALGVLCACRKRSQSNYNKVSELAWTGGNKEPRGEFSNTEDEDN
jgi:hypothetical protein